MPKTKTLESLEPKSTRANMMKQIRNLDLDEREDSKEEEDAESFGAKERRQNENIKMMERMRRERK